jgi:hypothetical protein
MFNTETYQVWIVVEGRSAWTGRKFSYGLYDAKLYGLKTEAEAVARKYGAQVQLFQLAAQSSK